MTGEGVEGFNLTCPTCECAHADLAWWKGKWRAIDWANGCFIDGREASDTFE